MKLASVGVAFWRGRAFTRPLGAQVEVNSAQKVETKDEEEERREWFRGGESEWQEENTDTDTDVILGGDKRWWRGDNLIVKNMHGTGTFRMKP